MGKIGYLFCEMVRNYGLILNTTPEYIKMFSINYQKRVEYGDIIYADSESIVEDKIQEKLKIL
jgi:hypothetical protein